MYVPSVARFRVPWAVSEIRLVVSVPAPTSLPRVVPSVMAVLNAVEVESLPATGNAGRPTVMVTVAVAESWA